MRKLFNTPEISLIGLGIVWITEKYLETGRISYITLLVTWLLFLQMFYKNRICGLFYGISLATVLAYKLYHTFILASETDAIAFNNVTRLVIFGIGFIMSASLFYKYARAKERYVHSPLTMTT